VSEIILPGVQRIAYLTTANTGGSLDINGPEGVIQLRRVDPHGVVMMFHGHQLSIHKDLLPILGRFSLAAAILLGVDINEGWDGDQSGGH
jgi:hypothetical protein